MYSFRNKFWYTEATSVYSGGHGGHWCTLRVGNVLAVAPLVPNWFGYSFYSLGCVICTVDMLSANQIGLVLLLIHSLQVA